MLRKLHRSAVATLALGLLATQLEATWSIIIIDTRTKEIALGSATCLTGFDLRIWTPVLIVGKGGATAQSFVDPTGKNRLLIFNEFQKDTDPAQILKLLAQQDQSHQTRQYGIVDTQGRAVTFSGTGAGAWAGGMIGKIGDLVYAVQGNVLTGAPVVQKAVDALRNTPGDVAEKMMAAMEAAFLMGGDGRCSCTNSNPTGCGSPPKSFRKAAHCGYMLIARQGDRDGVCNPNVGCGSGDYYMELNVANQNDPDADPVRQLRLFYDYWRIAQRGLPDHHLSTVELDTPGLPADGKTTSVATITLRDRENRQLTRAGATITVKLDPASTATVTIGGVTDKGNGIYTFPVTAGTKAGKALLEIVADDGNEKRLLSPRTAIDVTGDPLWASRAALAAALGGTTGFVLQPGGKLANRIYVLLASNSGSKPGIKLGNLVIPINPDLFTTAFLTLLNSPPITERTAGTFDGQGWASATFRVPPNALLPLKGTDLTFAFATLNSIDFASNPVVVGVR